MESRTECCGRCGKIFQSGGFFKVCPTCVAIDEEDFSKIKEYLYSHPDANIFNVVNDLNVSINKIRRYLKESRLEIKEENNRFLFCKCCGKPIRSGEHCDSCYHDHYSGAHPKLHLKYSISREKDCVG